MLDGDDAARDERAAVADAVDLVDDRHRGVADAHEIAMQRVYMAVGGNGALGGDERLGDGLAAEDPLPGGLRAATTIQIALDLLEIEYGKEFLHGG